jgi:hypothetical protein
MKNKYPYNKPVFSYDTYIDKLIRAKKSMKMAEDLKEEVTEAAVKMSVMGMMGGMKKKR